MTKVHLNVKVGNGVSCKNLKTGMSETILPSKVTCLGVGWLSFVVIPRMALGLIGLGTRVCFFRYKCPEHEGEHLPPIAEAQNGWNCDIISPICISGISLGHRSNFYKDLQLQNGLNAFR